LPNISYQQLSAEDSTADGDAPSRSGRVSQRLASLFEKLRHSLQPSPLPDSARAPHVFAIIVTLFVLRDLLAAFHGLLYYYTQKPEGSDRDPILVDAFGPAGTLLKIGIFTWPTLFLFVSFRKTRLLEAWMDLSSEEELDLVAYGVQQPGNAELPPPPPTLLKRIYALWLKFLYRAPERLTLPRDMIMGSVQSLLFACFIREAIIMWHVFVSATDDSGLGLAIRFIPVFLFMLPTIAFIHALRRFAP
jgi:hypothetical protein